MEGGGGLDRALHDLDVLHHRHLRRPPDAPEDQVFEALRPLGDPCGRDPFAQENEAVAIVRGAFLLGE